MPAYVFAPFPDDDIEEFVDAWVGAKNYIKLEATGGNGRPLSAVGDDDKLYVVCHGVQTKPVVVGLNGKRYTAPDLAKLLGKWGISSGLRDLRMFSCYSGLGIFKHPNLSKKQKATYHEEFTRLSGGTFKMVDVCERFQAQAFKTATGVDLIDPDHPRSDVSRKQYLPFVAYLASALKKRCPQVVVTGYHGPVSMTFGERKHVHNTPGGDRDVRTKDHRERWDRRGNREVWQPDGGAPGGGSWQGVAWQ